MQMKKVTDCYTLSNGVEIPCVGFGTWQAERGDVARNAVKQALAAGYRHIDTAAAYDNEQSVGEAVLESGIQREDIFITTKLSNAVRGYEETIAAFEESLRKINLTYIDLYLIHWPSPLPHRQNWKRANEQSWRAFETLYAQGKVRAIGVSNFYARHLDALLKRAKILPMVNQLRLCPGDLDRETVDYCKNKNILPEAYSPFGTGKAFQSPELLRMGEKYEKSVAQLCLRWSLQNGFLPLPKSVNANRIVHNTQLFDFAITPEDMDRLTGMTGVCGLHSNPDTVAF